MHGVWYFCGLSQKSQKSRHIVRYQVGPEFVDFFKTHELQVATKIDLYEKFILVRSGIQLSRNFRHVNNVKM